MACFAADARRGGTLHVVSAPAASLGTADITRRWALRCPDGRDRWPGLTRPEAESACEGFAGGGPRDWDAGLVRAELGVVLSDGAGPYLVDSDGVLVLVVAVHPSLSTAHIAMGPLDPQWLRIGVAEPDGAVGVWHWRARADVSVGQRVAALDGLDQAQTVAEMSAWAARWRAMPAGPEMP